MNDTSNVSNPVRNLTPTILDTIQKEQISAAIEESKRMIDKASA